MKQIIVVIVCLFATIATSAQKVQDEKVLKLSKYPIMTVPKNLVMGTNSMTMSKKVQLMKKAAKKAADVSSLYGSYIWYDNESADGGVDVCTPVTVTAAEDYVTTDETTGESYTYQQVHLKGLAQGYADVDGIVIGDTIIVRSDEVCYTDDTYGNMSLHGLYTDGDNLYVDNELPLVKNEDGNFELYSGYVGWVIYMDDYAAAGNESPYWSRYYNQTGEGVANLLKVNAYQKFEMNNSGWELDSSYVYVKKSLNNLDIYGFVNQGHITIQLNNDGTAVMPMGQPLYALPSSQVDTDTYGTTMNLVGVKEAEQEGYITWDDERESLIGEWSGNTTVIFESTQDDQYGGYYSIASKADSEGSRYRLGMYYGYKLIFGDDIDKMGQYVAYGTSGTCNWYITKDEKKLVIEPAGGSQGTLGNWGEYAPWYDYRETITGLVVKNTIVATTCRNMFYGFNLKSIDTQGLVIENDVNLSGMFGGCPNLLQLQWNSTASLTVDAFSGTDLNTNLFIFTPTDYSGNVVANLVKGDYISEVTLQKEKPMYTTKQFTAGKINYTREFSKQTETNTAAGWETITLPFTVQTIVSDKVGEITPFRNGAGSKHFWLASLATMGFGSASYIKANTPYIIAMPNSAAYDDQYNITGNVTFSAENATVLPTVESLSTNGSKYGMFATYEEIAPSEGIYAINDVTYGSYLPGSAFVSNLTTVKPFEAYVKAKDSESSAKSAFPIFDDTEATGIYDVKVDEQTVIYDVLGRRLPNSRKGINIINGRKVFVK